VPGVSASRSKSKPEKRVRRSADDARTEILDVAERRMLRVGPDGIRLQQIAQAIGVSHPALLHHFGTREELVEAVVQRALNHLETDLVRLLAQSSTEGAEAVFAAIEHVFSALVRERAADLTA